MCAVAALLLSFLRRRSRERSSQLQHHFMVVENFAIFCALSLELAAILERVPYNRTESNQPPHVIYESGCASPLRECCLMRFRCPRYLLIQISSWNLVMNRNCLAELLPNSTGATTIIWPLMAKRARTTVDEIMLISSEGKKYKRAVNHAKGMNNKMSFGI